MNLVSIEIKGRPVASSPFLYIASSDSSSPIPKKIEHGRHGYGARDNILKTKDHCSSRSAILSVETEGLSLASVDGSARGKLLVVMVGEL